MGIPFSDTMVLLKYLSKIIAKPLLFNKMLSFRKFIPIYFKFCHFSITPLEYD